VTDAELLTDLSGPVALLLDRHERSARPWYPHELVPWHEARDVASSDGQRDDLPAGVRSALVLNLLTEDNLPFYVTALYGCLPPGPPWETWIRRWTAEEMRHAIVIRDYLTVTRSVDLVALEDARFDHVARAPVPAAPNALEALVYVALQELATRIAHANTGRALPDRAGRAIMRRVAADENLHHRFYRDIVSAALELHPDATVLAIDAQVRHFAMPGAGMTDFREQAEAIAAAGIYSVASFHRQVLCPVLLGQWQLDRLEGLSPPAAAAQRRTLRFLVRMGRLADRLDGGTSPTSARLDAVPAGGGSS
jgi:acyl-[acyl-carrier-protein] desaturase